MDTAPPVAPVGLVEGVPGPLSVSADAQGHSTGVGSRERSGRGRGRSGGGRGENGEKTSVPEKTLWVSYKVRT